MAHAAIVSLARAMKQVQDQYQIHCFYGAKNSHESLYKNIMLLINFLEDFPEKHASSIHYLENKIRNASYWLEDLIEGYIPLFEIGLQADDIEVRNHLIEAFLNIEQVKSCITIFDLIVQNAMLKRSFHTEEDLFMDAYTSSSVSGSSRSAPRGQETMIGVEDDLNQIKDRVTGDELSLQIISIVGPGGIGKTTLARNVYADRLIEQRFDIRLWVTVSKDYNVHEVLQGLLPKQGQKEEHVGILIERVYKRLKNRRYLIILDDMWHDEVWDHVRRAFPDDYNYSRVIITTRLLHVTIALDSTIILHQMKFLNEDQSWSLLREKVYGKEHCPQQLEEVGKIIARNCRGLPLTIVVISGLLKVNKTKDYWDYVAKNIIEAIATNNNDFFSILSLSYNNLPHHLKACFMYMGIFPEDYKIPTSKLVKLWVADGFLKPVRSKSMEEVAEEYLEDLVNRNLVLITERRSNGRIRFCGIHDALRELSVKKGHEEKFFQQHRDKDAHEHNPPKTLSVPRRMIIHTNGEVFLPNSFETSHINSLLYFSLYWSGSVLFTLKFSLLRVLDGLEITSQLFPAEILNLTSLRYLAFTYNYSDSCYIPATISKLKNLETLIIEKIDFIVLESFLFMPSEIWNMPQLRHLILNRLAVLIIPDSEELIKSCSVLHNLQTLHLTDLMFSEEVIKRLPNLKKLRVKYLRPDPVYWSTYCINNLAHLQQLEELNFDLEAIPFDPNMSRFPQNLKMLTLRGSRIPWEKMSVVGSLPNLEVLKLKGESFIGREWEVTDNFLSLKHLEMESIDLENWIVEIDHFPRLQRLIIRSCTKLKEVPERIGDIATLQMLTIKECSFGVEESVRKIQEQQQNMENDDLKVHIVSKLHGWIDKWFEEDDMSARLLEASQPMTEGGHESQIPTPTAINEMYVEAADGMKKMMTYGVGSQASVSCPDTGAHASSSATFAETATHVDDIVPEAAAATAKIEELTSDIIRLRQDIATLQEKVRYLMHHAVIDPEPRHFSSSGDDDIYQPHSL